MIHRVENQTNAIAITWDDGTFSTFHHRWLRDNCQSPASMHSTGQRLIETIDIPPGIQAESVQLADDGMVSIRWHGDDHISEFTSVWLHQHRLPTAESDLSTSGSYSHTQTLWESTLNREAFTFAYPDVSQNSTAQREWLACFLTYGVAILEGVPATSGTLIDVASIFGYVRETNYGPYFDVKSIINPNNLAYTGLALSPHTDNPYRDPVPTIQLLHCLETDVSGGDSTIVDGFHIAEQLRRTHQDAFNLLATVPVHFRFQDDETDLSSEKTIIGLDTGRRVNCISFNNRSIQPFRLPAAQMGDFYDAYTQFATMVNDPQHQIAFKLDPGELFMVDNRRVLHGRTGYASNGSRHLQGCYADIDSLRSRLAVLERKV